MRNSSSIIEKALDSALAALGGPLSPGYAFPWSMQAFERVLIEFLRALGKRAISNGGEDLQKAASRLVEEIDQEMRSEYYKTKAFYSIRLGYEQFLNGYCSSHSGGSSLKEELLSSIRKVLRGLSERLPTGDSTDRDIGQSVKMLNEYLSQ